MSRPTQITIDLNALKHNFQRVRELAPASSIMAMVKSNAYGHGIERIGLALPDADALGVASLEEGLLLRRAGVKNPIVLIEGLFDATELPIASAQNCRIVVHQESQVVMLEKSPLTSPIFVWLKINTGMHRLGFDPEKVSEIYQRLLKCDSVKKPIGFMTHFAESDALDKNSTLQQIEIFNTVTQAFKGPCSLSNSGGILAWPSAHADWVRPGIMLYGASPFGNRHGTDHHLKPVMSLTSSIIAIHSLNKGSHVGYGGRWTCPEAMRIGVIAIGYGDGYPRHAKNGTPVLVNGQTCPLVGTVSMDMITVDLRTQPNARVGDPVLLWGPGLPVEIVANDSETNGYELLTRITQRVRVEALS